MKRGIVTIVLQIMFWNERISEWDKPVLFAHSPIRSFLRHANRTPNLFLNVYSSLMIWSLKIVLHIGVFHDILLKNIRSLSMT